MLFFWRRPCVDARRASSRKGHAGGAGLCSLAVIPESLASRAPIGGRTRTKGSLLVTSRQTSRQRSRPKQTSREIAGLLWWGPALLAAVLYLPSLRFEFVWDDTTFISRNRAAQSWSELANALSRGYGWTGDPLPPSTPAHGEAEAMGPPPRDAALYYRPVVTAVSGAQWITGRGAAWPLHLANMLAHAATAALVALLARKLAGRQPRVDAARAGLFAGLLFASHPAASEAVAWISGRTDLFATLFGLASLAVLWDARGDRRSALVGGGLLALALGSKESALAFVAVWMLTLGISHTERPSTASAVESPTAPRLAIATVAAVLTCVLTLSLGLRWLALGRWIGPTAEARGDWVERLGQSGALVVAYAGRLVWPVGLDVEAPPWVRDDPPVWLALLGWTLLAGLLVLAVRACRARAWPSAVGLTLALVSIAPVLQWIPTGEIFGERFLYLPLAGLALAATPSLARLTSRPWGIALALALVAGWSVVGSVRIPDWRNERSLFAASVVTTPESARGWMNLGATLLAAGDARAALAPLERAVQLDPEDPWKRAQFGSALVNAARPEEGARELEIAAARLPHVAAIKKNLAVAWLRLEKTTEAIALLRSLRASAPNDAGVVEVLAGAHRKSGDFASAVSAYEATLDLDPTRMDAHLNLISLLVNEAPDAARARLWAGRFVERFPTAPQTSRVRALLAN